MQTVIRHAFTAEEVAAALIPNVPKAQEIQVRFADGYVEIDIVGTEASLPAASEQMSEASEPDHSPEPGGDTSSKPETEREPPKLGKNANAVLELCALGGFQVYLDVDSKEAALAKVLETSCVSSVESLDNNKTALSLARGLKAEFEAWCSE